MTVPPYRRLEALVVAALAAGALAATAVAASAPAASADAVIPQNPSVSPPSHTESTPIPPTPSLTRLPGPTPAPTGAAGSDGPGSVTIALAGTVVAAVAGISWLAMRRLGTTAPHEGAGAGRAGDPPDGAP